MASISWENRKLCLFTILALILNANPIIVVEARGRSYLETNEVISKMDELGPRPETCAVENAVCGFLQANSKGINKQRLCSCPNGFGECSIAWDSQDGLSVTQGSDQYKFCGKAPALQICESDQPAYTSRMLYSRTTHEKQLLMDQMHCYCPEKHDYVMTHQTWQDPIPNVDTEVVELAYVCAPLPTCKLSEPCKLLSESGQQFLVNQKCLCPTGFSCPSVGNRRMRSYSTGINEKTDVLRCQSL